MANSFTSESDPLGQTTERLWFQNPIQALSPEIIRPISWSQVPSRLALYEEEDMLPQQTTAAWGGTPDFSSSYNVSTNISNEYNFDVQQNSTSFVFNYNNTNNTTEVSYTEGDIINNAGETIINNINVTGTSGATDAITSISSLGWDDDAMILYYNTTTTTVVNGLVTAIVHSGATSDLLIPKLLLLSNWYDTGLNEGGIFGSGVAINGNALEQENDSWVLSHGLVISITPTTLSSISSLTDCPP